VPLGSVWEENGDDDYGVISVEVPHECGMERNLEPFVYDYRIANMLVPLFNEVHIGFRWRSNMLGPTNPLGVYFTRLVSDQFPLLAVTIQKPSRDISHLFPIRKQYIDWPQQRGRLVRYHRRNLRPYLRGEQSV